MQKHHILWVDDEVELLKPYILFMSDKGYQITPINNGIEAIEKCQSNHYDMVFLDENMPGMSGLEALAKIKSIKPNLPIVMITKSEEERIMEEAIGAKIADYLIKPLNPNQILSTAKKILDNKRLVTEKTNISYQQDFRNIMMAYSDSLDHQEWSEIYKKLVFWELEIEQTGEKELSEILEKQKEEANSNFSKFILKNYESWLNEASSSKPVLSHQLFKKKVFPLLKKYDCLFFILLDNLRYDQWRVLETTISSYLNTLEEDNYYSILPTATAFARNAIFSGMMPSDMEKHHSDLWINDDEEEGESRNSQEEEFLKRQLVKNNIDCKFSYNKILNTQQAKWVTDNFKNLLKNPLNVLVYNFVDMLSHARTDMAMIKELTPNEAGYRSLTHSWFQHSHLFDLIKKAAATPNIGIVITTDHGTIRVKKPLRIVGDKSVNTNLRYKQGKALHLENENHVFWAKKPEKLFLPKLNVSGTYAFASSDYFFVYPNNYNYYANYYKDTFQHGGISMEEMIIPFIVLGPKNHVF